MAQKHYYIRLAEKMTNCRNILFWAFAALSIMAASLSFLPVLVQQILHTTFIEQNADTIHLHLFTITLLLIVYKSADYGSHYLIRKAGNRLYMALGADLFNTLLYLPVQQYQNLNKQQATDKAMVNIKQISRSAMQIMTIFTRDTLTIIGLLICLIWLDKDFVLLVILLIPFVIIMLQVIQDPISISDNAHKKAYKKLVCQLRQSIENFRQIRLYGGQQQECKRLFKDTQSIQDKESQYANYKTFIVVLCQLFILLIVVAISYLLIQQVLRGIYTLDQLGAFVTAVLLLITPIKRLAGLPQTVRTVQTYLTQAYVLFDQCPSDDDAGKIRPEICGKLTFENVYFFSPAPGNTASHTIDLEIKPGETVALVCDNKEARNRLIDLILGFCQPATGRMLLDDYPYTDINHGKLLEQFAMVSSEPVILNDKVAGNIAYGTTQCASEASITAATYAAMASIFVREMPEGLQTHVDDSGKSLTRQQWQSIAIARALLKNAPILIIDDHWPQPGQASPGSALTTLMQHRTVIILTPTPPVNRECIDRILILQNSVLCELSEK